MLHNEELKIVYGKAKVNRTTIQAVSKRFLQNKSSHYTHQDEQYLV